MNKFEQVYDLIRRKKNFQILKILLTVSMYLVFSFSIVFFIFNSTLYAISLIFCIRERDAFVIAVISIIALIICLLSLILTIMVFIDLIKKKKTRKSLFIGHSVSLLYFFLISIIASILNLKLIFLPIVSVLLDFLLIFFTITYLSNLEKISITIISLSKQISDADKEQN